MRKAIGNNPKTPSSGARGYLNQNCYPQIMDTVELVIESRSRELTDGFRVSRVLPSAKRRMIGPFIFLDAMGPEILAAGKGLDVAPHPHIGLATVTYLFKGQIVHRDSLGSVQLIEPGEVNWMTAGRGIAHSERTPDELRSTGSELFGLQSWVALPTTDEETEPAFTHYGASELPIIEEAGVSITLIAGSLFGKTSPVTTFSEMFYADVTLDANTSLQIGADFEERAIYIVNGSIGSRSEPVNYGAGRVLVLKPSEEFIVTAVNGPARIMLLGGEPVGPRNIWWNFVSSSAERIEQAKLDWKEDRFGEIPGETERIPLPADSRPRVVNYP